MFARLALLALAVAGCAISVPIQAPPRQIERPIAPIAEAGPEWAARCEDFDDWDKPAPPVRIHGNTYLVGTCGISAILIAGSDGHILIDSGTEQGAEVVLDNIRALGFRPQDVRILLHSHEHFDHVGGIAWLQQQTGAQLIASANASTVFATGTAGPGDPQAGMLKPFPAARVDRIVRDREAVRLGNLSITAIETKGHTHGALSWTWVSCEGAVCRTIVYADSLTPVSRDDYLFSDKPAVVAAFRASIARIENSECDILLTPHPSASDMRTRLLGTKPIVDPGGCRAYAAALTAKLDERLAKEKAR